MSAQWALGLMTGTVLDGNIDIAMIRTDGYEILEFGPWALAPYDENVKSLLPYALKAGLSWQFGPYEPLIFKVAEEFLTLAQAEAVNGFLKTHGFAASDISAIGFHGQTVLHRAPQQGQKGQTRQLGDGALMAKTTGITTVFDLRRQDMAAGGQGAPLAASYHAALLRKSGIAAPAAVLNLGGVANITAWAGGDDLIAFDTGPANAPLNDWVKRHGAGDFDKDSAIARQGKVDEARLAQLLTHPYLEKPYPKSLDRFDFQASMADGLSLEDGAATLTAFSAAAVGKALDLLPKRPARLIVAGGGRKNPLMMQFLTNYARVEVATAETVGWRGDAVEAELFAFLAARALKGLPISFPATTGVPKPMSGGTIALATSQS